MLDRGPSVPSGIAPAARDEGAAAPGAPLWPFRKMAVVAGRLHGSVVVWSSQPLGPAGEAGVGFAASLLAAELEAKLARDEALQLRKLARARGRELRSVNARLLQATDDERARLARELHDDIGQRLAALTIQLDRCRAGEAANGLGIELEEIADELRQAAVAVGRLAKGLHPSLLEHVGLGPAIRSLGQQATANWSLSVDVSVSDGLEDVPLEVGRCVYRVVQEALRNVARHAHTSRVHVTVHRTRGTLRVAVMDQGRGLPPDFRARGLGTIGMEERVRAVRGQMALTSRKGGGTTLTVLIPLSAAKGGQG